MLPPQRGHPNSILVNIPLGRPREAVHCFPRISLASAVCGSRASDLPLHVRLFIHDTDQDQFPEPSAPRLKSKEPLGPTHSTGMTRCDLTPTPHANICLSRLDIHPNSSC